MPKPLEVTTPSDTEIVVTRSFDAPAALVFACHTEPDRIRRWLLGPPGWEMPVCEVDLRVGGSYYYLWRETETGTEFGARGTYREIVAPHRIVNVERMVGLPESTEGPEGEALCTAVFTESGGRTVLTNTMRFHSKDARDAALATGMADGMEMSYAKLDTVLAEKTD